MNLEGPVFVKVVVAAPVEHVWRAWTEPQRLARWFKPDRSDTACVVAHDLRPGGEWRVEVARGDSLSYRVGGRFLVIEAPYRLAFTWRWEAGGPPGFGDESTVVVRLEAGAGYTAVEVAHARIPADVADLHRVGWQAALGLLEAVA